MVLYDITDDKIRNALYQYLLARGLRRIQYSVFIGELTNTAFQRMRNALIKASEGFDPNDSIIILPLAMPELEAAIQYGEMTIIDPEAAKQTLFY
jgi:CRISPR-associated endonuclease Cas2